MECSVGTGNHPVITDPGMNQDSFMYNLNLLIREPGHKFVPKLSKLKTLPKCIIIIIIN